MTPATSFIVRARALPVQSIYRATCSAKAGKLCHQRGSCLPEHRLGLGASCPCSQQNCPSKLALLKDFEVRRAQGFDILGLSITRMFLGPPRLSIPRAALLFSYPFST